MVQTNLGTSSQLVWRTPFPLPDSPSSVVSQKTHSWTVRDEVVRRFSDPASEADKAKTDQYIKTAVDAYHDAVASLRKTLKKGDVDAMLSTNSSTPNEVHRVALAIQRDQANVQDKRKMSRLVDVLCHYQGVFDVLAQCEFSYMTLIWGGLKFVLIASKNHQDMLGRLADMMVEIGLNLARVELYRHVFPTGRMLELVSELYAAVLDFIQQVIVYLQKKTLRKYLFAFAKPFDVEFGRLVERIRRLQSCIEDDARAGALVMQVVQQRSLIKHRVDAHLRHDHYEATLRDIHEGQVTPLFLEIKKTLFHGFEIEASYHEELAATFKTTSSPAWAHWLSIEQQYVPSRFSHETTLTQAECDAPDAATCLQWVAQARSETAHIVSAYLLWARGMTAQSAVASIVFQMIQQRPQVLASTGLTMKSFRAANSGLPKLWSLFLHLVRALNGLMVYISIGSVGEEEFDVVKRFVDLCKKWDGPPLNVILLHPLNDGFEKGDDCVDIDELYDVHPSLTTTDALYHVVLLGLGRENEGRSVSETVRIVLWEAVWREVRYAVIGIAVIQVMEEINKAAVAAAEESDDLDEEAAALWTTSVLDWTKKKRNINIVREQIQRHLNIVELHLLEPLQARLQARLRAAVEAEMSESERKDLAALLREGNESRPLEDSQRKAAWTKIQDAIRPGTHAMYSHSIKRLMGKVMASYMDDPPETEKEGKGLVQDLMKQQFGWNRAFKKAFLKDGTPVVEGIVASIDVGFQDVLRAILSLTLRRVEVVVREVEEDEPSPLS